MIIYTIYVLIIKWNSIVLSEKTSQSSADQFEPFDRIYRWRGDDPAQSAAVRLGEQALKGGRVAAVLLAGGMASRLGCEFPKGMYPIGFKSESFFEIFAQKIRALQKKYGRFVPLYVMTSDATDEQTREFFKEKNYFGLPKQDVVFFKQGNQPLTDILTGKELYSAPGVVAVGPDGHGGVLSALKQYRLLDDMTERGIQLVCSFQVDNPLIPLADPEFIGYCLFDKADAATMVVRKNAPMEKVGNMVKKNGVVQVIEYSELSLEEAQRRNADGTLYFKWGNVAIHVFKLDFLVRILANEELSLPFHTVKKKAAYIDENGTLVHPTQPNAYKKEKFIFDVFQQAKKVAVVEGDRRLCFTALKNSPESATENENTVRADMKASGLFE